VEAICVLIGLVHIVRVMTSRQRPQWNYRVVRCQGQWLSLDNDRPDLSSERADPSVTPLTRPSSHSKLQTRPLVRDGATT
jgi:hypothetical protein